MEDNQKGQSCQGCLPLVHLSSIDESCGKVDQASYHSPCSVNTKTIQNTSVHNTPPEQRSSAYEVLRVVSDVLGHEGHCQDVGDGDQEQADAGQDKEARGLIRPAPNKNPSQVEDKVDREGDGDCWGGNCWMEVKPSILSFSKYSNNKYHQRNS